MNEPALVITSIAAPNAVLHAFAAGCRENDMRFIVIGDRASPPDFQLDGCHFYDLGTQRAMPYTLAELLPERHYARKNLGYLEAIRNGASVIIESDDDNMPSPEFWRPRAAAVKARPMEHTGWVNMYGYYSGHHIWPRGFPLEHLRQARPSPGSPAMCHCPIQQGLADGDPDVDAIYRLTGELPITFDRPEHPYALGRGAWCPFNSQNTTWFREAYPLLYLPSHCSFRMTDIWRGMVAIRIAWENGWGILFHAADVFQERNEHDLLKDFADECPGYLNNRALAQRLAALNLLSGIDHIAANLRQCYGVLIDMGLVDPAERPLLEAWITDTSKLLR